MTKSSTTVDALVCRLDALERQNRRLTCGLVAVVLLAAGVTAIPAQVPSKAPLALTAERFTLVDGSGGTRAEIQTIQNGRGMLSFLDKDGNVVVRIGIGDRGPVLEARERDGKLHNFLGGPMVRPATQ